MYKTCIVFILIFICAIRFFIKHKINNHYNGQLIEIIGSYNNLLNNNITLTLMVEDHKCTSISYVNIKYYTSNLHDYMAELHLNIKHNIITELRLCIFVLITGLHPSLKLFYYKMNNEKKYYFTV